MGTKDAGADFGRPQPSPQETTVSIAETAIRMGERMSTQMAKALKLVEYANSSESTTPVKYHARWQELLKELAEAVTEGC